MNQFSYYKLNSKGNMQKAVLICLKILYKGVLLEK